jgi:anti-anti-sigma regulatory factor
VDFTEPGRLLRVHALGRFAAIVSFTEQPPVLCCAGDEDRTTQSLRRRALSRALQVQQDVLVDLSALAFADASLMVDLAMVARRLRKSGRGLRLRGAQPQIQALIERMGLHHFPGFVVEFPAPA